VPKRSAGLLMYRMVGRDVAVLLVHPGGQFWARKDLGAWSIPKGEYAAGEDPFDAARREFAEELGVEAPHGPAEDLDDVRQKGGKRVCAWALEGDLDTAAIESNTFELEWPPRSGRMIEVPEVDRAEWFTLERAREKINHAQAEFLDRLLRAAGASAA
jgi:predicted NUDIX family NTP pyrophosphohydrolase